MELAQQKVSQAQRVLTVVRKEVDRWALNAEIQQARHKQVLGEALLASGYIAYLGPMPGSLRTQIELTWSVLLENHDHAAAPNFRLSSCIGESPVLDLWASCHLPQSRTAIENALIMHHSVMWCLMLDPQSCTAIENALIMLYSVLWCLVLDPQELGCSFIKEYYTNGHTYTTSKQNKLLDPSYVHVPAPLKPFQEFVSIHSQNTSKYEEKLISAVESGSILLLENVADEMDDLLLKSLVLNARGQAFLKTLVFNARGQLCIKPGQAVVLLHPNFRLEHTPLILCTLVASLQLFLKKLVLNARGLLFLKNLVLNARGQVCMKLGLAVVLLHPDFRLYAAVQSKTPLLPFELLCHVCITNFSITNVQLTELLVTMTLKHEMPYLEQEHASFVKQKARSENEIMALEEATLAAINKTKIEELVEISEVYNMLISLQESSSNLKLKFSRIRDNEEHIMEVRRGIEADFVGKVVPFFFILQELSSLQHVYQFSLKSNMGKERLYSLSSNFVSLFYTIVSRSLFECDKMPVAIIMLCRFLVASNIASKEETGLLLVGRSNDGGIARPTVNLPAESKRSTNANGGRSSSYTGGQKGASTHEIASMPPLLTTIGDDNGEEEAFAKMFQKSGSRTPTPPPDADPTSLQATQDATPSAAGGADPTSHHAMQEAAPSASGAGSEARVVGGTIHELLELNAPAYLKDDLRPPWLPEEAWLRLKDLGKLAPFNKLLPRVFEIDPYLDPHIYIPLHLQLRLKDLGKLAPFNKLLPRVFENVSGPWLNRLHRYYEGLAMEGVSAAKPSNGIDKLNAFQLLLFIRCFQPHAFVSAAQAAIRQYLGPACTAMDPPDLEQVLHDSVAEIPIACISAINPPLAQISQFAEANMVPLLHMAVGRGQGFAVQKLIKSSANQPFWVVLENAHLAGEWMPLLCSLIQELPSLDPHPKFRLWLTMVPASDLPIEILQTAVKLVLDPPGGIKSYVLQALDQLPAEVAMSGKMAKRHGMTALIEAEAEAAAVLAKQKSVKEREVEMMAEAAVRKQVEEDAKSQSRVRTPKKSPKESFSKLDLGVHKHIAREDKDSGFGSDGVFLQGTYARKSQSNNVTGGQEVEDSIDDIINDVIPDCIKKPDISPKWKQLIIRVCIFHAVLIERMNYRGLAWRQHYEFTASDCLAAVKEVLQIRNMVGTSNADIDKALPGMKFTSNPMSSLLHSFSKARGPTSISLPLSPCRSATWSAGAIRNMVGTSDADIDKALSGMILQIRNMVGTSDEDIDKALPGMMFTNGQCLYGGKVTHDWDRRMIMCHLSTQLTGVCAGKHTTASDMKNSVATLDTLFPEKIRSCKVDLIQAAKDIRYLLIDKTDPTLVGLTPGAAAVQQNLKTASMLSTLKRLQITQHSEDSSDGSRVLQKWEQGLADPAKAPPKVINRSRQIKYPAPHLPCTDPAKAPPKVINHSRQIKYPAPHLSYTDPAKAPPKVINRSRQIKMFETFAPEALARWRQLDDYVKNTMIQILALGVAQEVALGVAQEVSRQLPFYPLPTVKSGWVAMINEKSEGKNPCICPTPCSSTTPCTTSPTRYEPVHLSDPLQQYNPLLHHLPHQVRTRASVRPPAAAPHQVRTPAAVQPPAPTSPTRYEPVHLSDPPLQQPPHQVRTRASVDPLQQLPTSSIIHCSILHNKYPASHMFPHLSFTAPAKAPRKIINRSRQIKYPAPHLSFTAPAKAPPKVINRSRQIKMFETFAPEALARWRQLDEYVQNTMIQIFEGEVNGYQALLSTVHSTVKTVTSAIKGFEPVNEQFNGILKKLSCNEVPLAWLNHPQDLNSQTMSTWIKGVMERLNFIYDWAVDGPPVFMPLGILTRPRAFLTSLLQIHAEKHGLAVGSLAFECYLMKEIHAEKHGLAVGSLAFECYLMKEFPADLDAYKFPADLDAYKVTPEQMTEKKMRTVTGPSGSTTISMKEAQDAGCLISNVMLQGAKWDSKHEQLVECDNHQIFDTMPLLWIKPVTVPDENITDSAVDQPAAQEVNHSRNAVAGGLTSNSGDAPLRGSWSESSDASSGLYVCPVYKQGYSFGMRYSDVEDCLFTVLLPCGKHNAEHWAMRNVVMLACANTDELLSMQHSTFAG
eukprot:gene18912-25473_t